MSHVEIQPDGVDAVEIDKESDVCSPLKTMSELRNWKPGCHSHSTKDLQERVAVFNCSKTLLCHDMKGGYLEDRYPNGVNHIDCYYFIHWSLIDVFVYFSHYFITIPPCSWISAAHTNGVKVLGTLITEHSDGESLCDELLCNENSIHDICLQLVNIAVYYNFDGWLINIENKLKPSQAPSLTEFLMVLTKKMHIAKPGSLVIWYDSVIESGELKWQNALNERNKNFFSACDGIYLNYVWTDETLEKSVQEAGCRKTDVYVGVDVFGRGCPGGGGFSTDIAIKDARKYGLSVAIFAPGWVFEHHKEDFINQQYIFWNMLVGLCEPRSVRSLPYATSFCPGFGRKIFRDGKVMSEMPWFNLSLQQPQPTLHHTYCAPQKGGVLLSLEDSYNGGGCLHLVGKASPEGGPLVFNILLTDFTINKTCTVKYAYKSKSPEVDFDLVLTMHSYKQPYILNLSGLQSALEDVNDEGIIVKQPASKSELLSVFENEQENPSQVNGWAVRKYILKLSEFKTHVIKRISGRIRYPSPMPPAHSDEADLEVFFGNLEILPVDEKPKFFYTDLECRLIGEEPNQKCFFRMSLNWTPHSSVTCWDLYKNISNSMEEHVATTSQSYYEYVNSFDSKLIGSELEFVLCPQSTCTALGNLSFKVQLIETKK